MGESEQRLFQQQTFIGVERVGKAKQRSTDQIPLVKLGVKGIERQFQCPAPIWFSMTGSTVAALFCQNRQGLTSERDGIGLLKSLARHRDIQFEETTDDFDDGLAVTCSCDITRINPSNRTGSRITVCRFMSQIA